MLLKDSFFIVINGIYNNPKFLVNHLKRELTKLKEKGFDENEFEHHIREVISLLIKQIETAYSDEIEGYKKQKLHFKNQDKEDFNDLLELDRGKIPILSFLLPGGTEFILPNPIYLADLRRIEHALGELLQHDIPKVFSTEEIFNALQKCQGLSEEEINQIKVSYLEYLRSADESFYESIGSNKKGYTAIELVFINQLLYPAQVFGKWMCYDDREKRRNTMRFTIEMLDLSNLLTSVSTTLLLKYEHRPETVESYLLHWENLIAWLKSTSYSFGHHLTHNPYYAFVEKWLINLKQGYPQAKLINRVTLPKEWRHSDSTSNLTLIQPDVSKTLTKVEKLKNVVSEYGFFDLTPVKLLLIEKQDLLIEMITNSNLPYQIAMFNFLGFINHLQINHFPNKDQLNKQVSKWLNSDKDGRAVKGNISVLSLYSEENKKKYTAHLHKEKVEIDYRKLK